MDELIDIAVERMNRMEPSMVADYSLDREWIRCTLMFVFAERMVKRASNFR